MKKYFLVIVSFTLLLVPELFHAVPQIDQKEGDVDPILKFDLMHVDHPDSPFYVRDRSVAEKFRSSLTRSRNRGISFASKSPGNQSDAETTFASPVTYSPPGVFLIPVSIGTPPQNFTLILDTGSDVTWVQCNPCSACYEQEHPLFEPTKSKTYTTVLCDSEACVKLGNPTCASATTDGVPVCQYNVGYGDLSTTSGDLVRDAITLTSISGRTKALDFQFGCGHINHGTFESTDGIVGFGRGLLSLPSQFGTSFGNIFSYCLDDVKKSSPLLLGKGLARTNLSWSPLLFSDLHSSFYYMNVTGISVNGKLLDIPSSAFVMDEFGSGGMIIDSGTTLTMLARALFYPVIEAMKAAVPYPEVSAVDFGVDLCYSTNLTNPHFPGAVFHFYGGAELSIPANNLWALADDLGTVCFAVLSSSFDLSILGNFQQQSVHIAYDLENNRIGFQSEVDCSTL